MSYNQSERPGSNRRQSAWKAEALPTELLSLLKITIYSNFKVFVVGEGFEPSKAKPADLQSALVDRLSIPPLVLKNYYFINLSRWRDSNPRPADYKSAALAS